MVEGKTVVTTAFSPCYGGESRAATVTEIGNAGLYKQTLPSVTGGNMNDGGGASCGECSYERKPSGDSDRF